MSRRSRRKNRGWIYFSRLVLVLLLVWAGIMIPSYYRSFQHLNVDKILNESVLKDKRFNAQVQEIRNGFLTAYVLEEHSNPIVSISFLFKKSGTAYVPTGKEGVAGVTAAMLTAGAGEYSEEAFRDALDEYGIKMGFNATTDDFSGYLAAPKQNLDIAVRLLNAALLTPHLDDGYLQLVKQQMMTALKLQSEKPEKVLDNKFKEFVFAEHPYARPDIGKKEDIQHLSVTDIRQFMSDKLAQDNLVVGVAGDVTTDEAKSLLQQMFGALPERSKMEELASVVYAAKGREYTIERQTSQAITHLVSQGTYRDSIDFYPLYVANYIFGESGLSSRLSKNIREKEGLTYGVYTYLSINDAKATIEGGFSATPENFFKALQLLKQEWLRMGQKGVSEQELNEAKNSLITSFNLRFAAIDDISDMLTAMQKYNLGIDFLDKRNEYIEKLSLKEVNAAAKKYFRTIPDFVHIGTEKTEEQK